MDDANSANLGKLRLLQSQLERDRRYWSVREIAWGWTRVLSFVGFFATYLTVPAFNTLVGAGMLFWVALFVCSFRRHQIARVHRTLADNECLVASESLQRMGGNVITIRSSERPAPPPDEIPALTPAIPDGPTWPLSDQERDDLDIVMQASSLHGPTSLFGLLNRTSTSLGARRLDAILNAPCLSAERILARQSTVHWLADHLDERTRLMAAAAGQRGRDERLDQLVKAVHEATPFKNRPLIVLVRFLSLVAGAISIYGLVQLIRGSHHAYLLAPLALNLIALACLRPMLAPVVRTWEYMAPIVENWLLIARRGSADLPTGTDLPILKQRFALAADRHVLPRLDSVLQWLNIGGAAQAIMNLLFLYDLQLTDSIISRVVRHRDVMIDSLAAAADLEALSSLACFAFEQPTVCYPQIDSQKQVQISDGLHPLIPPTEAFANSLQLSASTRTWLITGSNMSGKSTFLRMTGINVLLAQIGSAVTAREMSLCPVRLITDIRARDNLSRHESYYLAEVRQLRRMLDASQDDSPLFGLIDEPFRGTNSEEQAAASIAVVQSLIESPHFFIVATHERRLTDLGSDQAAANYHFRETLEESGSGMVFDYHLRPGAAQTRNAIRILQREGYPHQITERAARFLERHD